MASGNYFWCSPHCGHNRRPHPLALGHKALTSFREDPVALVVKLGRKVRQRA